MRVIHSPLMEYEELQQEENGGGGPIRIYGFVRLAYRDEIHGCLQFCRAYLPTLPFICGEVLRCSIS